MVVYEENVLLQTNLKYTLLKRKEINNLWLM